RFRRESPVATQKIVVAVDQYLGVPAWNDFRQFCGCEIGQAQVHGSAQMPQFELFSAARIKDYHARLCHRLQELIFRKPTRFPDGLDLLGVVQKRRVIDQPVWNLRLGACAETENGNRDGDSEMYFHMILSQWTPESRRMFVELELFLHLTTQR